MNTTAYGWRPKEQLNRHGLLVLKRKKAVYYVTSIGQPIQHQVEQLDLRVNLGEAMAISGAAIAHNFGRLGTALDDTVSFLLMHFQIRCGAISAMQ